MSRFGIRVQVSEEHLSLLGLYGSVFFGIGSQREGPNPKP